MCRRVSIGVALPLWAAFAAMRESPRWATATRGACKLPLGRGRRRQFLSWGALPFCAAGETFDRVVGPHAFAAYASALRPPSCLFGAALKPSQFTPLCSLARLRRENCAFGVRARAAPSR